MHQSMVVLSTKNWNEPYIDPDDKMEIDSARAKRRAEEMN